MRKTRVSRVHTVREEPPYAVAANAGAASVRLRRMLIAALQDMSRDRSFAGMVLAEPETVLSLQPGWATVTPDEAAIRSLSTRQREPTLFLPFPSLSARCHAARRRRRSLQAQNLILPELEDRETFAWCRIESRHALGGIST
jgi:hypothetical protein